MTALSDVLVRQFQADGGSPVASRRTVQCREILVQDNPTDAATDLVGLKRPSSGELEGALAFAADTDADTDPDDLRYSVDVCAVVGTGLEYRHGAAVAPTGDAVRTRCEVAETRRYLHVQSPEADGRVLTSPRVTEGAVTTRDLTDTGTTTDTSTWTTILTISSVTQQSRHSAVAFGCTCCSYTPASAATWGANGWLIARSDGGYDLGATVEVVGLVWMTTLRITESGSDLLVQVKGPEVAPHTWIAWASVRQ